MKIVLDISAASGDIVLAISKAMALVAITLCVSGHFTAEEGLLAFTPEP